MLAFQVHDHAAPPALATVGSSTTRKQSGAGPDRRLRSELTPICSWRTAPIRTFRRFRRHWVWNWPEPWRRRGRGWRGWRLATASRSIAGHGGLAEYGVFDAAAALPLPDTMPFETAAAFVGRLRHLPSRPHPAGAPRPRRDGWLVLGAAGGVGLTAVEIGAALGAEVVAVARGAGKLEAAQAAGAHHLVDSESADLRQALLDLGGIDVVYDAVGGDLTVPALRACRPEARLLVVGFASGRVPEIKANHLLVKNVDVIGFYWGAYRGFAPEALTGSLAQLLAMYNAGLLRPHVSETFPLSRAGEAMDFLASRRSTGKVVVTMEP